MTQGNLSFAGSLKATLIKRKKAPLSWKIRNLPNLLRGYWRIWLARLFGLPLLVGTLHAILIRANGQVIDYGLISTRVVTTAFVNWLATYFFNGTSPLPTDFDFHDCGTGVGAEAIGDTALGTPYGGARTNGTPTNPAGGDYRQTGTISFSGTFAITEHGLFSASSVGTLMDRSKFTAINVVSGDSIQFQYDLTITAGG